MLWGSGGRLETTEGKGGDSSLRVVYYAPAGGRLRVAMLFWLGRWAGAEAESDGEELMDYAGANACYCIPVSE
jgi:hypothetical protein